MPRLRSILGLVLCLVAAFGGRHASAQIIVTGAVQNASLPIQFVPLDGPKNVGGGVVEGTLPITATLVSTNAGVITFSNVFTAGSYQVKLGRSGRDWFNLVVGTNAGAYNWTALATNLNQLVSGFPLMVGATSGTDGLSGLVPQPLAGDEGKFLRGDATWADPPGGGGGGSGSYERVTAGTGITSTPSSSGGTNVFTVSVDGTIATKVYADASSLAAALAATNALGSAAFTLASDYQPFDPDLNEWAAAGTNRLSVYLTSSLAATTYQPLDADLTAWAGVNPSSYSTSSQIAAAYQPLDADLTAWALVNPSSYSTTSQAGALYQVKDADLDEWAAAGTNRLSTYLTSAAAATTYQAKDTDLDQWSAAGTNRLSVYLTSATAATTYQVKDTDLDEWSAAGTNRLSGYALKTYVDSAAAALTNAIAAQTNFNHLVVSNGIARRVNVVTATSNGTNYLLNSALEAQLIAAGGNVRLVGLTGSKTGYRQPFSIMVSNTTAGALTVEWTNTFKAFLGSTNILPSSGVTWIEGYDDSGRVSLGALREP